MRSRDPWKDSQSHYQFVENENEDLRTTKLNVQLEVNLCTRLDHRVCRLSNQESSRYQAGFKPVD